MGNENLNKTKKKVWLYRDGTLVVTGILLLGFGLQVASGGIILRFAGFPWNLLGGIAFCAVLSAVYFIWKNHKLIKWVGGVKAALPAILGFTFLVLLMGFVKQDVQPRNWLSKAFGLTHLVRTWPFILINVYLLILLGIIILKRLSPLNLKNAGFFLNHFGLFLVLFSTSLGSADIKRLTMDCYEGRTEVFATNEAGKPEVAPFTIRLLKFNIEEYRPKIAVVDSKTGSIVPEKKNEQFVLLDKKSLDIGSYHVETEQFLDSAVRVGDVYQSSTERGSAPAARLKVTSLDNQAQFEGWICSGSYNQQPEVLPLDDNHSLMMLNPEPKKISSRLEISKNDGHELKTVVEINKPVKIDGWNIYQLNYDTELGRWSDLSVLELIRDPWLPVVYAGIFMMMAGAVFLFIFGKPKSGGTKHVA